MLRLFFGALGRLPAAWHDPLAEACATLLGWLPLRRAVLEENLNIAFGTEDSAARKRRVRGIYVHTIHFALELARLRFASADEVTRAVRLPQEAVEIVDALHAQQRGYIIGCAHQGNWEWLGAWYSLTWGRFGVVYKPMHNPDSDAVARQLRERFGIKILSTRERVPRGLFSLVRSGGVVAILADQDARSGGRFVPFFGKPASTATGLASLALRLNAPILPGFCLREGPCRYRVKVYPPLIPDPAAPDREAEEMRLTAAYLACVEDVIREAPEQYFWWHRRWKTQPKARREEAVAVSVE